MTIGGIHHVTAIAGSPAGNVRFYRDVLGLRLVKRTVNFDDPGTWHLYFGDAEGTPGSILTFFPHPDVFPGRRGVGQAVEVALAIPRASLAFWIDRLATEGVHFSGPRRRFGDTVVSFNDPDGLRLELVADASVEHLPGWGGGAVDAQHAIRGIHGVTLWASTAEGTARVLASRLGYVAAGEEDGVRRYVREGAALGRVIDIREPRDVVRGAPGAGTVHHVAFRAADDAAQAEAAAGLGADGLSVTGQRDRNYFRSVYFREPSGILFEIATDVPGFAVDEPADALGGALRLPEWLEGEREAIERALPPLERVEELA